MTISANPLQWPVGWPRASRRTSSMFDSRWSNKGRSVAQCRDDILAELARMGINENDVVISTNLPLRLDGYPRSDAANPADPGVAVYWRDRNGESYHIACDRWQSVRCNMHAIALTLAADRGKDRWGCVVGNKRFAGYRALPAVGAGTGRAWWVVLGCAHNSSLEDVEAAYRRKVKTAHPDVGGDANEWGAVQAARNQALDALGVRKPAEATT